MVANARNNDIQELTDNFQRQTMIEINDVEGHLVEITGLDLLVNEQDRGFPEVLDDLSVSENSSSIDDSYANDSIEIARQMRKRRAQRRPSQNSFSNDSVELARHKHNSRTNYEESLSSSTDEEWENDFTMPLKPGLSGVKNISAPPAVPADLDGLKPVRISNSAA